MIRGTCALGAIAGGATQEQLDAACRFAAGIGLAFQIEDDLLDMGTEDNKMTFLTFMTPDEARAEIARLTDEAVVLLSSYANNAVLTDFAMYLATRTV